MSSGELWSVTLEERAKHDALFAAQNPQGGFLTGGQARDFFLKSNLSPTVLAQVWSLADYDSNGKLGRHEFSIALHLIRRKLEGHELPPALPPSLRADPLACAPGSASASPAHDVLAAQSAAPAPPVSSSLPASALQSKHPTPASSAVQTPTALNDLLSMDLAAFVKPTPTLLPNGPPVGGIPVLPHVLPNKPATQSFNLPLSFNNQFGSSGLTRSSLFHSSGVVRPYSTASAPLGLQTTNSAQALSQQLAGLNLSTPSASAGALATMAPFGLPPTGASAPAPLAMFSSLQTQAQAPFAAFSLSSAAATSAGPDSDWAIPISSRRKNIQQFNELDKQKHGFLTALDGRNALVKTGLSTPLLAQIWSLSDVNADGKLTCDEYCLAMHLVEMVQAGQSLPAKLPPELVPPSMRTKPGANANAKENGPTPASSTSQANAAPLSGEDKRRENFMRGQQELERRQQALREEMQRAEQARLQAEREAEERKERARKEAERKRLEELERLRQIEEAKEAERRRVQEERERARRESEKQRLVAQLSAERLRERQMLEQTKQSQANVKSTIENTTVRKGDLAQRLEIGRQSVTEYSNAIGQMRTIRDTLVRDIEALQLDYSKLYEELRQFKEMRMELNSKSHTVASPEINDAYKNLLHTHGNKQLNVQKLRMEVEQLEQDMQKRRTDLEKIQQTWTEVRSKFDSERESLLRLEASARSKREQFNATKSRGLSNGFSNDAWVGAIQSPTSNANLASAWPASPAAAELADSNAAGRVLRQYKVLFAFEPRNPDELELRVDDVLVEREGYSAMGTLDEGWMRAQNTRTGLMGLFPSGYVTETALEQPTTSSGDMYANSDEFLVAAAQPSTVVNKMVSSSSFHKAGHKSSFTPVPHSVSNTSGKLAAEAMGVKPAPAPGADAEQERAAATAAAADPGASALTADAAQAGAGAAEPVAAGEATNTVPGAGVGAEAAGKVLLCEGFALYAFEALQPNHLSFSAGDCVRVLDMQGPENDWWFGECNGRNGWFPKNGIKVEGGAKPPPAGSNYLLSLYQYTSTEPGDLQFGADVVIVQVPMQAIPDWHNGYLLNDANCTVGMFPANYVRPLTLAEVAERQLPAISGESASAPAATSTEAPAASPAASGSPAKTAVERKASSGVAGSPPKRVSQKAAAFEAASAEQAAESANTPAARLLKKQEVATVIAAYTATSSEQLSLKPGQVVIVRSKAENGWWEGELQARGQKKQVGWFPASYVKLKASGRSTPDPVTAATGADKEASRSHSASNTPVPIGLPATSPATSAAPTTTTSGREPAVDATKGAERVVALFAYTAQHSDELSFKKDDMITLVERGADPDWWKGELDGRSGLFPANYIRPLTDGVDPREVHQQNEALRKRQYSIQEIIDTEETFNASLLNAERVFFEPLRASSLLSAEEIAQITLNWPELIAVSTAFLGALRERKQMWTRASGNPFNAPPQLIGDILCRFMPKMTPFVTYVAGQQAAGRLLKQRDEADAKFRELSKQLKCDARAGGLDLSAFLLKPMQRVCRYHLLFKTLLSYTPQEHADYTNVLNAWTRAEELAGSVNQSVAEREDLEHLEWLQTHVLLDALEDGPLTFNSVSNSLGQRRTLKMGTLFKMKSGKELYAFCFTDMLLLTVPSSSLAPAGERPLSISHSSSVTAGLATVDKVASGAGPAARPLTPSVASAALFEPNSKLTFKLYQQPVLFGDDSPLIPFEADADCFQLRIQQLSKTLKIRATSAAERDAWSRLVETQCALMRDKTRPPKGFRVPPPVGRLMLAVVEAGELACPAGKPLERVRPICEVTLLTSDEARHPVTLQVLVTKPAPGTLAPKWNHTMQFNVTDLHDNALIFVLYDRETFAPNAFLGRASLTLRELHAETRERRGPIEKRIALRDTASGFISIRFDLRLF